MENQFKLTIHIKIASNANCIITTLLSGTHRIGGQDQIQHDSLVLSCFEVFIIYFRYLSLYS